MESHILHNPYLVFSLLLLLHLAGIILERLARQAREKHILPIFMHEDSLEELSRGKSNSAGLLWLWNLAAIAALFVAWYLAHISTSAFPVGLYLFSLGLLIALFTIRDVTLVETIYIANLIKTRRNDIEGKLLIKKGYSRRREAYRLFTVLIILTGVLSLEGGLFYAGAVSAPLLLIIRNLALAKS